MLRREEKREEKEEEIRTLCSSSQGTGAGSLVLGPWNLNRLQKTKTSEMLIAETVSTVSMIMTVKDINR